MTAGIFLILGVPDSSSSDGSDAGADRRTLKGPSRLVADDRSADGSNAGTDGGTPVGIRSVVLTAGSENRCGKQGDESQGFLHMRVGFGGSAIPSNGRGDRMRMGTAEMDGLLHGIIQTSNPSRAREQSRIRRGPWKMKAE